MVALGLLLALAVVGVVSGAEQAVPVRELSSREQLFLLTGRHYPLKFMCT